MPDTIDPEDALRRIAALADEAAGHAELPASLQPLIEEIRHLATTRTGDTPEPSDLPRTENQSL